MSTAILAHWALNENVESQKRFMTPAEAATVYGLPPRQLKLMRMAGRGPKFLKVSGAIGRPGGRVLYSVEDIEVWLASRPQGGGERPEAR